MNRMTGDRRVLATCRRGAGTLRGRMAAAAGVLGMAVLVAGCGSTGGGGSVVAQPSAAVAVSGIPIASSPAATPAAAASTPTVTAPAASPSAPSGAVAAGSGARDACRLLPIDQASSLAGATLTETVKDGNSSSSVCQYKAGHTYVNITVKWLASRSEAGMAFTELEAQLRAAGGTGSVTPVSGIGDQAVESRDQVGGVSQTGVAVVSGAVLMSILTDTAPSDASLRQSAASIVSGL
jgi:hypothetical protein